PTVVGRPEPVERDVLRRFQDPVPDFFGRLHPRVDWIDHAYEHPLAGLDVLLHEAQRSGAVRLTRALDIEVRRFQFEARGPDLCGVYAVAVRGVAVAPRTRAAATP